MAPVDTTNHAELENQIKNVIQDLYRIMVTTAHYDAGGRPSKDVISGSMKTLSTSLQALNQTATSPSPETCSLPKVPPELVQYVEGGRNPDIYTREFVEIVRRGNQLVKGKMSAFGQFRDVLAENITAAMPELADDVRAVVEATRGEERGERDGEGS